MKKGFEFKVDGDENGVNITFNVTSMTYQEICGYLYCKMEELSAEGYKSQKKELKEAQ